MPGGLAVRFVYDIDAPPPTLDAGATDDPRVGEARSYSPTSR